MKQIEISIYLILILVCEGLEPRHEKTKTQNFLLKKQMDRALGVEFQSQD